MRLWVSFTVASFAVALLAAPLMAQEGGRGQGRARGQPRGFTGMGRMGMGTGKAMLLRSEQVQKELKISEEQKTKITEVVTAHQKKSSGEFAKLRDVSREERREKMTAVREKLTKELDKQLKEVLKKEQFKRLEEISVQQRGTRALTQKDMVAALKLSEEQVEKINGVFQAQGEKMRELFQELRNRQGERGSMREAMEKLRKETDANAIAVLTDEQKKKYESLKGKPFELDRASLYPRRGDRGARGGRGGGEGGDRPQRPRRRPGGGDNPDA
jgi:Spy/CpxP family protein refolding chaperone